MGLALSLSSWTKTAESLEASKNLLYFRQLVGLKIDKRRLASIEARSSAHYMSYLRGPARAEGAPRGLYLMSVAAVGAAGTYRQLLRLYEARSSKIVSRESRYGGAPVTWGSWRQFSANTDDSAARKRVFDDFLGRSGILSPLIKGRFEAYRAKLAEFGTDPLSAYLELEGLSYERLDALVRRLGELAKGPFTEALARYSHEVVGRTAEYFDDFYFFRSRVFKRYSKAAPTREKPIEKVVRTMRRMGLDASKVPVDDTDRKGKSASAFCSGIRIPSDVRISYRRANPFEDFAPVFHEFGHAIHFSSIDPGASFFDRYGVANGVAEVFSIFFEGLVHEKGFLTAELGIPEPAAEDIVDRFRFSSLYFAAFYAANSTLKLGYWHDSPPFESLDGLYSDLTERYLGIRYPGAYWKLHHVMPDYFLYSPSYLVAAVRALELRNDLIGRFGERYWRERGAGARLLELMRPGQSVDLGFSKLDESAYVRSLSAA
ncbi:MAG: hypothetical protein JRN51_11025 [Nitrososphaerota archaeon]|nr:hypothetical protein [Nitrososphaerota archaeon]MDG6966553.1 hypothetical protein [Nitrososphaerota archaeon]MDG6978588.1 hypothetical protein [Nitrososphaerota archaeon]MDG6981627.1 hypothetical protein [Nitrososphaerota archaeon]